MDLFTLSHLFAWWKEIEHLTVLTGLSATALAGCGVALYFGAQSALVRHAAVFVAGCAISACAVGLYEHGVGRREVLAEWDAAKVAAAAAAKRRDADAASATAKTFDPVVVLLQQQEAARQQKVTNVSSAPAPNGCRISAAALRLRQPLKPARK